MKMLAMPTLLCLLLLASPASAAELPLVYEDSFDQGANNWEPTDPNCWKVAEAGGSKFFSQFEKCKYSPPYRSPLNFALLKDVTVGDFILEAKCRSTVKDYGHRDMCLFFGYRDPSHFYYVHLGKQADDHANQIFIVNSAPRTKISTKTTTGTNWTDDWHHVKIVRSVGFGTIEVFFDDMKTPVMTATDKTFTSGRIGLGTFDDTGDWDDVKLYGTKK